MHIKSLSKDGPLLARKRIGRGEEVGFGTGILLPWDLEKEKEDIKAGTKSAKQAIQLQPSQTCHL